VLFALRVTSFLI